jgi:hypothetical protein
LSYDRCKITAIANILQGVRVVGDQVGDV